MRHRGRERESEQSFRRKKGEKAGQEKHPLQTFRKSSVVLQKGDVEFDFTPQPLLCESNPIQANNIYQADEVIHNAQPTSALRWRGEETSMQISKTLEEAQFQPTFLQRIQQK